MMQKAELKVIGTWLIGGRHIVNVRHEADPAGHDTGLDTAGWALADGHWRMVRRQATRAP